MSTDKCDKPGCDCSCHHEPIENAAEKKNNHDYKRRDFIKHAGHTERSQSARNLII